MTAEPRRKRVVLRCSPPGFALPAEPAAMAPARSGQRAWGRCSVPFAPPRPGKLTTPCDTITPAGLVPPEPPRPNGIRPNPAAAGRSRCARLELDPPSSPLAALLPIVGIVISAGSRPAAARAIRVAVEWPARAPPGGEPS